MTKKIITWVDQEGRYRVTSPAYNDTAHRGKTEDALIAEVLVKIKSHYGLADNHVFHFVEDADQRTRLEECCGTYFRYVGMPDATGQRSGIGGAWEMDVDGRPKVNMTKARTVQMDFIRIARNAALEKSDVPLLRALAAKDTAEQTRISVLKQALRDIPQTFDLSAFATPDALKAAWPDGMART